MTPERIDLLAGALEVEEALLSLKSLVARFPSTPGAAMSKLARALRGGCAQGVLEHFDVCFANLTEESLNLLADMVEARARIPGCQRSKFFEVGSSWLEKQASWRRGLQALDLSLNPLYDEGVAALTQALLAHPDLVSRCLDCKMSTWATGA